MNQYTFSPVFLFPILIISFGILFAVIGILIAFFGVCMVGGSGFFLLKKKAFANRAVSTPGTVIHVERMSGMRGTGMTSSSSGPMYKPTVRFQSATGMTIDYTPKTFSNWACNQVGETVPVLYDPNQPDKISIGKTSSFWVPAFICLFTGVVFAAIGLVFLAMSIVF